MAGIAIAFGLLIDNAIVMLDHYRQQGNLKVFLALLAATLTTMAALLLVFLLPEADRQNLSDFAAIIAVALLASLVSSLGFTPALYTILWGKNIADAQSANGIGSGMRRLDKWYLATIVWLYKYRRVYLTMVLIGFGLPLFLLPDTLEGDGAWARLYNNTLGNSWYRQNVRPIADQYLGGALYQFRFNVFEKSGYRSPEKTKLYIQAALPFGHTPKQMNTLMTEVDNFLKRVDGIEKFVTEVHSGQQASVSIQFTPAAEREGLPYSLKSRLIARAVDWGGADWEVYGVGKGFSNGGNSLDIPNFRLRIKGYNYDQAARYAAVLAEKLLKHPRIQKVNTNDQMVFWEKPKQQYFLELNQVQLANAFTQPGAVYNAVSGLTEPAYTQTRLAYQNNYLPVQIMEQDATDFSVHQLMHTGLKIDSMRRIKLDKAGSLELKTEANEVVRENRSYVRMVSFDYLGSSNFGSKYLEKVLAEMKPLLLPGYSIEEASYGWNWGQAKRQYGLLFLLALAVFAICAVLFGHLRQSLYIVCMIPLSFIGLFLTFAWGNFYFDQGGYAAFVLLSGLVVNAAIFIINDYNLLVKQYPAANPNTLLIQAIKSRALTILLTTLSTCIGLAPFIWEGQQEVFWFSFAVGAIGGLLFSLLAVAFVLPVLLWRKSIKVGRPYSSDRRQLQGW
jgi:multidrug efflux pump subunit AcrB